MIFLIGTCGADVSNDFSLRSGAAHLGCSSEEIPASGVLIIKFNEEDNYKVINTQSTPNKGRGSDRDVYVRETPVRCSVWFFFFFVSVRDPEDSLHVSLHCLPVHSATRRPFN